LLLELSSKLKTFMILEVLEEVLPGSHLDIATDTHGLSLWVFARYEDFFLHLLHGRTRQGDPLLSLTIEHGKPGARKTLFSWRGDGV